MIYKQRAATNYEERLAAIHEISRFATDQMVTVPAGPGIEQVDLVWKALRGPQIFKPFTNSAQPAVSSNTYLFSNFWFDKSL